MKILLIYPPDKNMITTNVPQVVDEETGIYPPLGLLYVASYLLENSKHSVEILDTQALGLDYPRIEEEVRKRKPDLVGIQTLTFTIIDAILTAKSVKAADKNLPVVLGGPHVFLYPEQTIQIPEIDYLVLGEGEKTFLSLVNCLETGSSLSQVKGLAYRKNETLHFNPPADLIQNLEELPILRRQLLPVEKYYSVLARQTPITTMMSSRGCPYKCTFCDRPHLGKTFRARGAKSVVDEMEACQRLGIKEIFFYDDTFAIHQDRVAQICQEILRRKLAIGWDVRLRVDAVSPELLRLMARAGCLRIHYGVEAGTPEIIKVLRKQIDLETVREVFYQTRKAGITTLAYFMLGNPTETKEQILRTIKFAQELNPDYVHFSLTTPFPGTELYRQGLTQGIIPNDFWLEFARSPQIGFVPPLWEEKFTRDELVELLMLAYKKFYARPGYIVKQCLRLKSLDEFRRKARAGLRLLFQPSRVK